MQLVLFSGGARGSLRFGVFRVCRLAAHHREYKSKWQHETFLHAQIRRAYHRRRATSCDAAQLKARCRLRIEGGQVMTAGVALLGNVEEIIIAAFVGRRNSFRSGRKCHQPCATPQISTVLPASCIIGFGTSVTGGSAPPTQSPSVLANATVSSSVPVEVK